MAVFVPIAMAVAAVAGAVGNAIANKKKRKELAKAQEKADIQAAENRAWYEKEINTPFTESTEAKSALELAREQLAENSRRDAQASVITGGSNESNVARKEAANKSYNNLIKSIAAQGTAQRNFVENTFRRGQAADNATQLGLTNQRIGLINDQAESWNNLMQNAFSAASSSSFGKQNVAGTGFA